MQHKVVLNFISVALTLACTCTAWADTNSLALINLTGPITAYTGSNIKIGQVEGPGVPDTNNVYIQGPVMLTTNLVNGTSGTVAAHSTEVAGVLIGVSNNVPGVAPGASLYSVEDPSPYGPASQTNTIAAAWWLATNQNVNVINMSDRTSSPGTNTLGNDYASVSLDRLVSQTRVSFVKSAGNEGPTGNTITEPGGAYNIITVGAVTNLPGPVGIADFSSRGYLSNGRSALDIVAPGVNVTMPTSPAGPSNNALTNDPNVVGSPTHDGTSFAAPHVTGVIARLLQAGAANQFTSSTLVQDPRVIKAALLNSATKLAGWQQGTGAMALNGTFTPGVTNTVTQPLDANQGAGLLNANGAYGQLAGGRWQPRFINNIDTGNLSALTGWDFNNVKLTMTNVYQLTSQPVSGTAAITLDWYRDVGLSAGTNLVNGLANLTLQLYSSPNDSFSNATLVAQSISSVDNLQHLYFTNLPSAYYEFSVGYPNYAALPGGTNFNLVTYGAAWDFTAVPEPSSLLLAALGVTSFWWAVRRRRRT